MATTSADDSGGEHGDNPPSGSESSASREEIIRLISADGQVFRLDVEAAFMSRRVMKLIEVSSTLEIRLPLTGRMLGLVVDYCKFHTAAGKSEAELKDFDDVYVKLERRPMFRLMMVVNYLKVPELMMLLCEAVAERIKNRSAEEIRAIFMEDDMPIPERVEVLKLYEDNVS